MQNKLESMDLSSTNRTSVRTYGCVVGKYKAFSEKIIFLAQKKTLELYKKPNRAKPDLIVKDAVMINFSFCYTWLYFPSLVFTW